MRMSHLKALVTTLTIAALAGSALTSLTGCPGTMPTPTPTATATPTPTPTPDPCEGITCDEGEECGGLDHRVRRRRQTLALLAGSEGRGVQADPALALRPNTNPKPIADNDIARPSTTSLRREATSTGSSVWVTALMLLARPGDALQWPLGVVW